MVSKVTKLKTNTLPKVESVVNGATEYGVLFNKLNQRELDSGRPPLTTAMEVLIMAMNSPELDIVAKAKIADKMASYESSRAPVITVDYVQSVTSKQESDADGALEAFMQTLAKSK